jgi:hypothetical protein
MLFSKQNRKTQDFIPLHNLVGPFTIRTPAKEHSACTNNDRLSKPQISQQHPFRICFIKPGWHVIGNLNLLYLTMRIWEFKRKFKQMCNNFGMMFHLSSISNDKEGVKTQEICYFQTK